MKKLALFILFIFIFFNNLICQESSDNFIELKKTIETINPNLDLTNRLIFVEVWKSSDFESRELNKEAFRVYKIYEKAKLKNGEKGVVFLSINLDDNSQIQEISIKKDSVNESVVYTDKGMIELLKNRYNMVDSKNNMLVDKNGLVVFKNIQQDQIFSSFNFQITR